MDRRTDTMVSRVTDESSEEDWRAQRCPAPSIVSAYIHLITFGCVSKSSPGLVFNKSLVRLCGVTQTWVAQRKENVTRLEARTDWVLRLDC
ncbi:hypothetical protein PoB_005298400 [Plakobranchus ocellatus]|uniref:Uncharacterized protein n=1 Tax=Plakobranchus ocellatus TaxID=259542 RepID=A0AAV4C1T6_9GAST|nr:hypothetical protein PoB_005298400 [Plakobranchus ocellatus]